MVTTSAVSEPGESNQIARNVMANQGRIDVCLIVIGSPAGSYEGLYLARAICYRSHEVMTQSIHTSFFEPDLVDQTFNFIIAPISMVLLWIPLIPRRSLFPPYRVASDSLSTAAFFSSLDHVPHTGPEIGFSHSLRQTRKFQFRTRYVYSPQCLSAKVCRL